MINIRVTKLNCIVPFLLLSIISAACFSGCSVPESSASDTYSVPKNPNRAFGSQSEPVPTARTLYSVANILAAQGKDLEREAVLKRIIREYPKFFPVYNSLAELQMRRRHTDEAIKTIRSGLRIRPKDTVLLNNLGICQLVLTEYEEALEVFSKAARIMPENARYRANMAVALSLMGRYEESLSLFKEILSEGQANHNVRVIKRASGHNESTGEIQFPTGLGGEFYPVYEDLYLP